MIKLNGRKFAISEDEMIESVFHPGGTCVGYYKLNKRSISLMDLQRKKIGVICNNVLGKATKLDNGKYWYSYGQIDIIGEFNDARQEYDDIRCAMNLLNK